MGRNIRFWFAPGVTNDNVLTPATLTVHTDTGAAVIEVRPPVKGEQGWQCWPDTPLAAQIREMLADWNGDPPGWTATHNEENGNHEGCFYITVIAAFDLGAGVPAVRHSLNPIKLHMQSNDELLKAQGFKPERATVTRSRISRPELPLVGRTEEVHLFLRPVIEAMNVMEEIGGPSDGSYLVIMESIANEARRRAESLKRAIGDDLDEGDAAHGDKVTP